MNQNKMNIPEIEPLPDGELEVITTHVNADFDALGSMLAISKLYPKAQLVFPGSQEQNLRNFFLQSTVYFFPFSKLKEEDFKKVKRLILVDTRQAGRIKPLEKILKNKDLQIHIYDHHPAAPGDLKGDLEVLAEVGSTSTLLTEILQAKEVDLTPEEATVMALGIHEDTGSLTFVTTTPRDYMAAAYLLARGADLNLVSEMMTHELTSEQVSLLNELINSIRKHNIYGIDIILTHAATDHYVGDFAVLVHKLIDMENVKVLFAMAQMEDHIYLVARSRVPEIDVAEIARYFGGGGHASAASASIKNQTLTQVEDSLLALLKANVEPLRKARDIMSFPVISISPEGTLEEARQMFTRYDINVLLVQEDDGPLLGYISQQNVSKALHHGLARVPISEFMTSEFKTIGQGASFPEIIRLVAEQKQRIIPVVEDDKPIGVITRTDLLTILASETNVPGSLVADDGSLPARHIKKIGNLLRERLPDQIIDLLTEFGLTADRLEFSAYAVGGFIRDLFIRQENLDIDIVVEGDGIEFAKVFAQEHPGVRTRYHRKFNSAVLIFEDGFKVDIATARLEYYESPAALPVVRIGSLRMDLYRRDFTVNTLAVKLNKRQFGLLIDYFRGVRDIKQGNITVLHNLSFVEDPTRVFRAIRFEQRFGFRIGKLTSNLIQNAVKHDFFDRLSGNRIFGELKLILQEDDPAPATKRLADFDLLKCIHSGLTYNKTKVDLFGRIKKVRDWYELTYLGEEYQSWIIYFLGLMNGLKRDDLDSISNRLILNRRDRHVLIEGKVELDRIMGTLHRGKHSSAGKLYRLLKPLTTEAILFLMAKTTRENTRQAISTYFIKLKKTRTEITGKDLISMGFTPGPDFKKILDRLLEARLDGRVNTRTEEKEFIKRTYLSKVN
jgi:tRNA nucleotidyltransferase (CCA-adding enzyme)